MVGTRGKAEGYRLEHWAKVMQERRSSGLSIKAYCRQMGISGNTYYYWQRRLRSLAYEESGVGVTGVGFAQVKVDEPIPELVNSDKQSTVYDKEQSQLRIEVGGLRITVQSSYPVVELATLLRGLMLP